MKIIMNKNTGKKNLIIYTEGQFIRGTIHGKHVLGIIINFQ